MRTKLQKKTVTFAGKSYILFSLDGNTWSTNPDELALIVERHQALRNNVKDSLTGVAAKRASETEAAAVTATEKPSSVKIASKPSAPIAKQKAQPSKLSETTTANTKGRVQAPTKVKAKAKNIKTVSKPSKTVTKIEKSKIANTRASQKPKSQVVAKSSSAAKRQKK